MKKIIVKVRDTEELEKIEKAIKNWNMAVLIEDNPKLYQATANSGIETYTVKGEGYSIDGKTVLLELDKNTDLSEIVKLPSKGVENIFLRVKDWKIIPIENLISRLQHTKTKLYVFSKPEEIETMTGILERGVDGVVLESVTPQQIQGIASNLGLNPKIELKEAIITDVKEKGLGDRVCIDTASLMEQGEGLLIGSFAKTMLLVHAETLIDKRIEPRPFRVNAGAVHSYILQPNLKTKYLSELKAGDSVLIVNHRGKSRKAIIGRLKIEKRPLILVNFEINGETGSILLQNAETVCLTSKDGKPIQVTKLQEGLKVLAYVSDVKARHFGVPVEEHIIER